MKVLSLLLVVVGVLGDKPPYAPSGWKPQGSLLLLPQEQYGPPPPPSAGYGPPPSPGYGPPPPAPPQEYGPPQNSSSSIPNEESLEKVNERIMERLKNEEGSDSGVYYVYLPDGRLQRVQYTTAPLKEATEQDQQNSYSNRQQYNTQSGAQRNFQNFDSFRSFSRQKTSYDVPAYPPTTAKSERFANEPFFQPAQFPQLNRQETYPKYEGTSKVAINNNEEERPGSPSQLLAKYSKPDDKLENQNNDQQQPAKYVASVSFTDVNPIKGPIYSYNSQPLVRVLRYAPMFQ